LTPETAVLLSALAKPLVEAMATDAWPAIRNGMVKIVRKRDPRLSDDRRARLLDVLPPGMSVCESRQAQALITP
jgi:hypothetical protein